MEYCKHCDRDVRQLTSYWITTNGLDRRVVASCSRCKKGIVALSRDIEKSFKKRNKGW